MQRKLAIITATRNHSDRIIELFKDLKKQTFQDFYFIVMDDVSEKDEAVKLNNIIDDRVHIITNPPPHKFDGDRKFNTELRYSINLGAKYIYNIHDDMKIDSIELLEKMVAFMDENVAYGAIAPTILNRDGKINWGPGIIKERMGRKYIMNETYLVRSKCYVEMGFINEKLIYYGSEYYIFNWLCDNDYLTKILGDVRITHFGGGTSLGYQNEKDYYRPRTTILIMKLFLKDVSLYMKIRYFYDEISEPRLKMVKYFKNLEFFKLFKTFLILITGTIAGLFINIKMPSKRSSIQA